MVVRDGELLLSSDLGAVTFIDGEMERTSSFDGELGIYASAGGIPYEGETTVVPKAYEAVTLPTKETFVKEDITVTQVPLFVTENTAGGNTVYIAKE